VISAAGIGAAITSAFLASASISVSIAPSGAYLASGNFPEISERF
jgi:hypothetical protein